MFDGSGFLRGSRADGNRLHKEVPSAQTRKPNSNQLVIQSLSIKSKSGNQIKLESNQTKLTLDYRNTKRHIQTNRICKTKFTK